MSIPIQVIKKPYVLVFTLLCLLACMAIQPAFAKKKQKQATGPLTSTANCWGHYPSGIFRYDGTSTNYKISVHFALNYGKSKHPELFDNITEEIIQSMNAVNPSIQYQQAEGEQPYFIIQTIANRNSSDDRYGLLVIVNGPQSIDASGGHYDPPFSTAYMRTLFTFDQGLQYTLDGPILNDAGTKIGQYLSNGWSCSNPDRP
jgi:hypothetical protein